MTSARWVWVPLLLLLTACGARTPPPLEPPDPDGAVTLARATSAIGITGTITANGQTVVLTLNDLTAVSIQLTGTWTGTVEFETTTDGTNWASLDLSPSNSTSATSTATANGIWQGSAGGRQIRVRATAWTSGTLTASLNAFPGSFGGGGGGGGGGGVTTDIEDGAGDSVMDAVNNAVQVNVVAGSTSGTEYTEGDVDTTITGGAILWEDGANTLATVTAANPLPVDASGAAVPVTDNATTLSVDDGASSLTVDGTVTADAGTGPWPVTDNGGSLSIDDGGNVITVDGTVTTSVAQDVTLDLADAVTGWAACAGTDTDTVALSSEHAEGTGSISFNKTNTATNSAVACIEKTLASVDLTSITATSRLLVHWFNLPSTTNVLTYEIWLGTDASNYTPWSVSVANINANTWDDFSFPMGATSGTPQGTGLNPADVDYIRIQVTFADEANTLTGILADAAIVTGQTRTDISGDALDNLVDSNASIENELASMNQNLADAAEQDQLAPSTGVMGFGDSINFSDGSAFTTAVSGDGDSVRNRSSREGVQYVTLVNPTGALSLFQLEDDPHASGDPGMTFFCVRQDSQANLGADGDYTPCSIDASGALRVTGGGGGTEYVVNVAAPTDPTGATFTMERDDALSTLTEIEADWTNPRSNARGALWVELDPTNAVVVDLGANNDVTLNANADVEIGQVEITDGTDTALVTPSGELQTNMNEIGGNAVSVGNGVTDTGTQRVTLSSDGTGLVSVDDNGASLTIDGTVTVGTFPDNEPIDQAQVGGTAVVAGHCAREEWTRVAISQTADTAIIAGTASEHIYICQMLVVAGAAEIINITSGTGTACGTGEAAVYGSVTEANGISLTANQGFVLPPTDYDNGRTVATGDDLCLIQDGTDRLAGHIAYVKH